MMERSLSSEARAAFDAPPSACASPEEEALFFDDVGKLLEAEEQEAAAEASIATEARSLDESIAAVARFGGSEPTMEQVFDVLRLVHAKDGRALGRLEVRPSASPVVDVGDHAYVVLKAGKKRRAAGLPPGFAVTFQSVHNSEHWFPPGGGDLGVACRPMARSARRVEASQREAHGYRGRLYVLVAKEPPGGPRKVRVVDDGLGLVRAWRDDPRRPPGGGGTVSSAASTASSDDGGGPFLSPAGKRVCALPPPPPPEGDDGDDGGETIFLGSMRGSGDVTVRGSIFGRVVTPPEAADYAEWFPWRPSDLASSKQLGPGTVVQLTNGSELSLDTSGAGACMVVSTTPSIAAGVPADAARRGEGALVAFVGQVPVRCRGPVRLGDHRTVVVVLPLRQTGWWGLWCPRRGGRLRGGRAWRRPPMSTSTTSASGS